MSQHQQQHQQQKPQQPQVDRHWRFVVQSGDVDFATRARNHVRKTYGAQAKVTTTLGTRGLTEQTTVVVLYKDPAREIRDKDGTTRPRRMTAGYGKDRVPGEKCEVLESKPVKCDRFYREGRGDDEGAVSLKSWTDQKGTHDGLLAALTKACASVPDRAGPVRCQYDDRNELIQVWST